MARIDFTPRCPVLGCKVVFVQGTEWTLRPNVLVGIGYTGPCPIVTKFLPVMPQITLITNLVLVCGADVPFFFGNFFYTIFSPIVYCYTSETTHNFLNPIADSDSPYSILSKTNISTP